MAFSNLWQGRTGRLAYLIALVISSAAIAVLPYVAARITVAHAGGMDPAMAIVRAMLQPALLAIGLLIAGGPLVFFARQRMRDLGLSGVWLLLFPIDPLQMLLAFGVASTALLIGPTPILSPVTGLPFWVELAFGASLALLPGGDYLERSANPALRLAHLATTCEGRIGRQTFALHLAIALGLMIVLQAFGASGMIRGYVRPGEHSASMLMNVVAAANALLTTFVMMFLTASTIRRLHDLNQRGWWIIFFPFGLTSLIGWLTLASMTLGNLRLLSSMLLNPYVMFSSVQGLGCLILLVWLLSKRGSSLDNPYGPPDDPLNHRYAPA
jgi:uncharacterized membrane protein YhaH (DUF805 family)